MADQFFYVPPTRLSFGVLKRVLNGARQLGFALAFGFAAHGTHEPVVLFVLDRNVGHLLERARPGKSLRAVPTGQLETNPGGNALETFSAVAVKLRSFPTHSQKLLDDGQMGNGLHFGQF